MSKQIKIGADTTEIRRSVLELAKTIQKDLGKSKIDLFTAETKKMLRGEAVAQAERLKRQIDAIKNSTRDHEKALQNVVKGSKEELKLKEKILKASQRILEAEKDRSKIADLGEQLGASKGGFFGGLRQSLNKLPGAGMLGRVAGMSGMGAAGLLGGGALIGAGAYGISRVMASRETYGSGVNTRIALRGRGISDMAPEDTIGMHQAGMNSLSLRQARLRDMDVFGAGGSTQAEVIKRAKFERNFGIEEGTLSGIGSSFRSSMGAKGANMTLMKLQASLMASGISDAIGPYLETAANMLTELNERGFTMDESVTSLFNSLLKTGMGEGRIQQLMTGVDSGIRGATGESNAFFQTVFGKGGIGGGTIGGAQAAMRMGGLFGVDLDKYKGMGGLDRRVFQTLGIGGAGHMQNVAGGTLSQLDKLFGSSADINKQLNSNDESTRKGGALRRLSRLRYMMGAFGLKDEGQAAEVEGLLGKAKTASPEEQKKIMRKIQDIKENTPELENLKKINASNEGIYKLLENEKTTIEDAIGEATSGAFNAMNELLRSIDEAILAIAKFLTGYETPAERQAKISQEQAVMKSRGDIAAKGILSGSLPVGSNFSDLSNMDWKDGIKFTRELKKKMDAEGTGVFRNRLFEDAYNSEGLAGFRAGIAGEDRRKAREAAAGFTPISQGSSAAQSSDTQKQSLIEQKKMTRFLEITAKNSRERGTLKPSTGSTTGQ